MPGWLDEDDVARELGVAVADALVTDACLASEKQVQNWRDDLDWDAPGFVIDPDIYKGAVIYAALLYQSRNTPEGFPGFGDVGGNLIGDQSKMTTVYRLVRARRPKVG